MKEKTPRRRSLQLKLNALLICSILLVAAVLSAISYYFFCQRVDNKNYAILEHAAMACANNVDDDLLANFWAQVNTEEFRSLRARALEARDEDLIADWLRSKQGWYVFDEDFDAETESVDAESWTLMNDYEFPPFPTGTNLTSTRA